MSPGIVEESMNRRRVKGLEKSQGIGEESRDRRRVNE